MEKLKNKLKNRLFDLDVIEVENTKIEEYMDKYDLESVLISNREFFIKNGYMIEKNKTSNIVSSFEIKNNELIVYSYLEKIDTLINGLYNLENDDLKITLSDDDAIHLKKCLKKSNLSNATVDEFITSAMNTTLISFFIVNYLSTNIVESIESKIVGNKSSAKKVSKNKKSKNNKKVSIIKKYYINSPKNISESKDPCKNYNRHAESWTVRGHYKNYKSGKKIWVEGYQKGEGKKENKIYKI